MALKTDYKDDVFSGDRKYQKKDNSDGTISLVDKTAYSQKGDIFSATDINATNKAVNGLSAVATTSANGLMSAEDKSKLDNLQIGGRNLLLNSGVEVTNGEYLVQQYLVTPYEGGRLSNGYGYLVPGKHYTITICVTPGENVKHYRLYVSDGYASFTIFNVNGTGKQIISVQATCAYWTGREPDVDPSYARVQIYRDGDDGVTYGNTTIHWIKVEEGTVATDWTPAPEDVKNEIKALNSVTKSFTLSASSWSSGTYTISDSLITASSNQEILPATNITAAQYNALSKAQIIDGGQSAGKLTLKALGTVPTIDIPIRIIFRGTI